MQFFAPLLVWVTVGAVNIVGVGFVSYSWYNYYKVQQGNGADSRIADLIQSGNYNENLLLGIGVFVTIVVVAVLLMSIALRKRISLAISLIQETVKAVKSMPLVIFFPIWKYLVLLALTAWTIYIWAMLVTSGQKITGRISDMAEDKAGVSFEPNQAFQAMSLYVLFGYLWTFNWILAIAQTTIAGAVASWYWTRDKKAIPKSPVWKALKRTLRYHLGSLAIGALVVGVIQFIRVILLYIQSTMKKNKESKIVQTLMTCLQCCFACIEKVVKFLNKNAYIEIAIYGYSFMTASKTAFQLLVRNAVRVAVIDRVGGFLFFLGKIMITMATCMVGAYALQATDEDQSRFWAVPLIIIAVLSYVISSLFMAVIDMAIDTIFLCFCEDSERNDGKTKPYYMPDSLRNFVDESSKAGAKI